MLENNIKNLIKILEDSKVDELEISTFWGKQKIKIRKKSVQSSENNIEPTHPDSSPPIINAPDANSKVPTAIEIEKVVVNTEDPSVSASTEENTLIIKAPLVGTYYQSTKPGTPPFISEGDIIKTGQVICIIEAMKIFNEIESELS